MSKIQLSSLILGTFGVLCGLIILPGCEVDTECTAEVYECPEGEQTCDDTDEEGCKEYTFGEGDCSQVIFCAEVTE